jgi:hypothetical protein
MLANKCLLCGRDTKKHISDPGRGHPDHLIDCAVCGYFIAESDLVHNFASVRDKRHLLSGYTREFWEASQKRECLTLRWQEINLILEKCPQTVKEKADKLLYAIHRQTHFFGEKIPIDYEIDYPFRAIAN